MLRLSFMCARSPHIQSLAAAFSVVSADGNRALPERFGHNAGPSSAPLNSACMLPTTSHSYHTSLGVVCPLAAHSVAAPPPQLLACNMAAVASSGVHAGSRQTLHPDRDGVVEFKSSCPDVTIRGGDVGPPPTGVIHKTDTSASEITALASGASAAHPSCCAPNMSDSAGSKCRPAWSPPFSPGRDQLNNDIADRHLWLLLRKELHRQSAPSAGGTRCSVSASTSYSGPLSHVSVASPGSLSSSSSSSTPSSSSAADLTGSTYWIRPDFLSPLRQPNIQPRHRVILAHWMSNECEDLLLRRTTFHAAVALCDRFLSLVPRLPKAEYHPLGVACLLIAAKLEEVHPPELATLAASMGSSEGMVDSLKQHEVWVCKELGWNLHPPTAIQWLQAICQHIGAAADAAHEHFGRIQQAARDRKDTSKQRIRLPAVTAADGAAGCLTVDRSLFAALLGCEGSLDEDGCPNVMRELPDVVAWLQAAAGTKDADAPWPMTMAVRVVQGAEASPAAPADNVTTMPAVAVRPGSPASNRTPVLFLLDSFSLLDALTLHLRSTAYPPSVLASAVLLIVLRRYEEEAAECLVRAAQAKSGEDRAAMADDEDVPSDDDDIVTGTSDAAVLARLAALKPLVLELIRQAVFRSAIGAPTVPAAPATAGSSGAAGPATGSRSLCVPDFGHHNLDATTLDDRWSLLEDCCAWAYRVADNLPVHRRHKHWPERSTWHKMCPTTELPLLQSINPAMKDHVFKIMKEESMPTAGTGSDGGVNDLLGSSSASSVTASTAAQDFAPCRPPVAAVSIDRIRQLIPELTHGWAGVAAAVPPSSSSSSSASSLSSPSPSSAASHHPEVIGLDPPSEVVQDAPKAAVMEAGAGAATAAGVQDSDAAAQALAGAEADGQGLPSTNGVARDDVASAATTSISAGAASIQVPLPHPPTAASRGAQPALPHPPATAPAGFSGLGLSTLDGNGFNGLGLSTLVKNSFNGLGLSTLDGNVDGGQCSMVVYQDDHLMEVAVTAGAGTCQPQPVHPGAAKGSDARSVASSGGGSSHARSVRGRPTSRTRPPANDGENSRPGSVADRLSSHHTAGGGGLALLSPFSLGSLPAERPIGSPRAIRLHGLTNNAVRVAAAGASRQSLASTGASSAAATGAAAPARRIVSGKAALAIAEAKSTSSRVPTQARATAADLLQHTTAPALQKLQLRERIRDGASSSRDYDDDDYYRSEQSSSGAASSHRSISLHGASSDGGRSGCYKRHSSESSKGDRTVRSTTSATTLTNCKPGSSRAVKLLKQARASTILASSGGASGAGSSASLRTMASAGASNVNSSTAGTLAGSKRPIAAVDSTTDATIARAREVGSAIIAAGTGSGTSTGGHDRDRDLLAGNKRPKSGSAAGSFASVGSIQVGALSAAALRAATTVPVQQL